MTLGRVYDEFSRLFLSDNREIGKGSGKKIRSDVFWSILCVVEYTIQ